MRGPTSVSRDYDNLQLGMCCNCNFLQSGGNPQVCCTSSPSHAWKDCITTSQREGQTGQRLEAGTCVIQSGVPKPMDWVATDGTNPTVTTLGPSVVSRLSRDHGPSRLSWPGVTVLNEDEIAPFEGHLRWDRAFCSGRGAGQRHQQHPSDRSYRWMLSSSSRDYVTFSIAMLST